MGYESHTEGKLAQTGGREYKEVLSKGFTFGLIAKDEQRFTRSEYNGKRRQIIPDDSFKGLGAKWSMAPKENNKRISK